MSANFTFYSFLNRYTIYIDKFRFALDDCPLDLKKQFECSGR